MEVVLRENERIDDLEYKGLKIIQNTKWFCFGMDAVLLSDFAKDIKSGSKVIDIGTGTGIIGILLCEKTKLDKLIGLEIQEQVAEMANRSIILNNLENKMEIVNDDVKNLQNRYKKKYFDVVVTNPPYKKINTGAINENENKIISRHEVKCNLEDIIKNSSEVLKDFGSFYMVHRPERLVDILELLRKYKIEPKLLKFVYPHQNNKPNLVLIKAVKNAKSFLDIEKPLVVYNEDGTYTEEILKIYNKK